MWVIFVFLRLKICVIFVKIFRRNLVKFFSFMVILISSTSGNQQSWCDVFSAWPWSFDGGQTICRVPLTKSIYSPETSITLIQERSVRGLEFNGNRNVAYLPINVSAVFPNLIRYSAGNCSIVSITKSNFEGLTNLRELLLYENLIEEIPSKVFDDLTSLEVINLGKFVKVQKKLFNFMNNF